MILSEDELASVRRQAEAEYPAECCGVVLIRAGTERRLYPCRNVQDRQHAANPASFPRTSRTAYYMDPDDTNRFLALERDGYTLSVIYHSHVDVPAYFSETDRQNALGFQGEPAYPTATYVVVSVKERRAVEARAFRWDPGQRDFLEVPLGPAAATVAVRANAPETR